MKVAIMYAYPPEPDGLSLQGHMLYLGMKENGVDVVPVHHGSDTEKEWIYEYLKPDVVIGVGYWNNTPEMIEHPKRFGITPVPWFLSDGWVANYQKEIQDCPLVFTTCDWVRSRYERDGVDTANFQTSHIGFDIDQFKPYPKSDPRVKAIRRSLGIGDGELMLLTVGGDVTSKGAQEVLKALKIVDKRFKNWKYVCKIWGGNSGDDHHDDEQRLIGELGESSEKVQYMEGPLSPDYMPFLISACDIYLAPSRIEGFGMIQVEAMLCGKPVISINVGGPAETIVHGKTGFLASVAETVDLHQEWAYEWMGFEEDHIVKFDKPKTFAYRASVDELAQYMLRLMEDEKLRKLMGLKARLHSIENFEYHHVAKRFENILKDKLGLK